MYRPCRLSVWETRRTPAPRPCRSRRARARPPTAPHRGGPAALRVGLPDGGRRRSGTRGRGERPHGRRLQARPRAQPQGQAAGLLAIFLTAQIGRAGRWRPVGRSRVGRAGLEVTAPGLSKSIPGGAPAPGLLNTLVQTSAVTRRSAWPKGHPQAYEDVRRRRAPLSAPRCVNVCSRVPGLQLSTPPPLLAVTCAYLRASHRLPFDADADAANAHRRECTNNTGSACAQWPARPCF